MNLVVRFLTLALYIKLTNASLRDQNPDDDEEEDEYYKWKAAKANQVAPEP